MKSKTIIIIFATLVVLGGLFFWGYENSGASLAAVQGAAGNSSKSALSAPEIFYDFGTISMKNGKVSHEFSVTNLTGSAITISDIVTSCMCTTAFLVGADGATNGPFGMPGMGYQQTANEIIKAGESRIVRVVFDPNAHGPAGVGMIDRFITLTDSNGGALQLEIKAEVTP